MNSNRKKNLLKNNAKHTESDVAKKGHRAGTIYIQTKEDSKTSPHCKE